MPPGQTERAVKGKACERHEWVVFSTALKECWLMLQCVQCGIMGTVEGPTEEEWAEAFHAPSRPYRWLDDARVVVKGFLTDEFYAERDKPKGQDDGTGDDQ
jgi:hypothetical protein